MTASLDRREARGPIEAATDDPKARKDLQWAMLEFANDAINWIYVGIEPNWSAAQIRQHIEQHVAAYTRRQKAL
ncbi:hypothetical protein [Amycolatopsis sp.]|jgi:hypothetical protein|uniref:hypothetical protein n=1 Tax=Amycolatopsis sp. TaxID=37632 RepID=UPI002634260E|nr:hypothetical protein [Amycolatopsis sp.]